MYAALNRRRRCDAVRRLLANTASLSPAFLPHLKQELRRKAIKGDSNGREGVVMTGGRVPRPRNVLGMNAFFLAAGLALLALLALSGGSSATHDPEGSGAFTCEESVLPQAGPVSDDGDFYARARHCVDTDPSSTPSCVACADVLVERQGSSTTDPYCAYAFVGVHHVSGWPGYAPCVRIAESTFTAPGIATTYGPCGPGGAVHMLCEQAGFTMYNSETGASYQVGYSEYGSTTSSGTGYKQPFCDKGVE